VTKKSLFLFLEDTLFVIDGFVSATCGAKRLAGMGEDLKEGLATGEFMFWEKLETDS
jgi:hypothetical protein